MAEAEAHAPVAAPVAELICEDAQVTKGCQKIGYS